MTNFHYFNILAAYNTARFDVNSLHGGNQKRDKQLLPDDGKGKVKVSILLFICLILVSITLLKRKYFILTNFIFRSGLSRNLIVFCLPQQLIYSLDSAFRSGVSKNSRKLIYQKRNTAYFTMVIVTLFCTRIKFVITKNTLSIIGRCVTLLNFFVSRLSH